MHNVGDGTRIAFVKKAVQSLQNRHAVVGRTGWNLERDDRPIGIHQDQISEGSADVDANPEHAVSAVDRDPRWSAV
jgi:hypothetical protein